MSEKPLLENSSIRELADIPSAEVISRAAVMLMSAAAHSGQPPSNCTATAA